jgi:hypothetical protein
VRSNAPLALRKRRLDGSERFGLLNPSVRCLMQRLPGFERFAAYPRPVLRVQEFVLGGEAAAVAQAQNRLAQAVLAAQFDRGSTGLALPLAKS